MYQKKVKTNSSQSAPGSLTGQAAIQLQDNRAQSVIQKKSESTVNSSKGGIQMMRPHKKDVGRSFIFYWGSSLSQQVGEYLGPSLDNDLNHRFQTRTRGIVEVPEDSIIGYRPTVGGMHPPGQIRPPEENVKGRNLVLLSEADLSGAMARQRENPGLLNQMVVTTYENKPDYPDYDQNARDLESQGVPILSNFDISEPSSAKRLKGMGDGANIHFQMPRVPRVKGYSTQKLIKDTLSIPKRLHRKDVTASITAPDPSNYTKEGTHNMHYGLESGKSITGSGMKLSRTSSDEDMGKYGYVHKQSTVNKTAEVSKKRKRYYFVSDKNEHEDFHGPSHGNDKDDQNPPPSGDGITGY